jgi:formylmethanofuran dehydrogenase subunit E
MNHWLIRVGDGYNLKHGKHAIWGVKRGKNNSIKGRIQKNFNSGDIIWFITNKENGGKIIAMVEYIDFHDREDETLININTITNEEQGWKGNDIYDIQINFKNYYNVEKHNFDICIKCANNILSYRTFKEQEKISYDLEMEYELIKKYANVDKF